MSISEDLGRLKELASKAVFRHHLGATAEAEPDDLFRLLLQISEYHLETRPLSSGRSGEATGEVSLSLLPFGRDSKSIRYRCIEGSQPDGVKLINRIFALQFKLTDGFEFFAKGTSAGVLQIPACIMFDPRPVFLSNVRIHQLASKSLNYRYMAFQ